MEANHKEQTITLEQLQSLLERVREGKLLAGDLLLIEKLIVLDIKLFSLLKKKKTTLKQLRELVFVEKTAQAQDDEEKKAAQTQSEQEKEKKPRAPGHGRNGAADYTGAKRVLCTDEESDTPAKGGGLKSSADSKTAKFRSFSVR